MNRAELVCSYPSILVHDTKALITPNCNCPLRVTGPCCSINGMCILYSLNGLVQISLDVRFGRLKCLPMLVAELSLRRYFKSCSRLLSHFMEVCVAFPIMLPMGLLPDTYNCGLRMRRECRRRFPRDRQRKPLVSDPGMHHGACITQMPRCLSGSLTRGGRENVTGIPGACTTRNFTYLARGPRGRQNKEMLSQVINVPLHLKRGWFKRNYFATQESFVLPQ